PKYLPAQAIQHLGGGSITSNPAQLRALPPVIHHGFVQAFSHSLQTVFLIGVPVAIVAFALTWLLKEVPLREQAFLGEDGDVVGSTREVPDSRKTVDIPT
ncbi:MAG: hypothetical protein ACRD0E_11260, partial [Acidimicrobiales bacterium]